jgi:hypothetical protein
MNAVGTQYEAPGEWFKLGAQLYFYGWANETETGFEKWAILDVAKYKTIVEESGGLGELGSFKRNRVHGAASFYAIPIRTLRHSFLATYAHPHLPIGLNA